MKKRGLTKVLVLLLCTLLAFLALSACTNNNDKAETFDCVRIEVSDKTEEGYSVSVTKVDGSKATLIASAELKNFGEVLRALKTAEKLTYVGEDSGYGLFLSGIDTLLSDWEKDNNFVSFYSTIDLIEHIGKITPIEKDGVNYWQTNKGVDQMPLMVGTTYLFRLEVSTF